MGLKMLSLCDTRIEKPVFVYHQQPYLGGPVTVVVMKQEALWVGGEVSHCGDAWLGAELSVGLTGLVAHRQRSTETSMSQLKYNYRKISNIRHTKS